MAKAQGSTKLCPKCKLMLDVSCFGQSKDRSDGLKVYCKTCIRGDSKSYYQSNKEAVLDKHQKWRASNKAYMKRYGATYYQKNREKIDRTNKSWYARHPEVLAAQRARHYRKNTEVILARNRLWQTLNRAVVRAGAAIWRQNNREQVAALRRAYKLRKQGATGSHTGDDIKLLFVKQNGRCAYCRDKLRAGFTHVDHHKPLSRGGSNGPENLQLTCRRCNLKKGPQDPIDFARRMGLLL